MERAEWLKYMQNKAETLYDHFGAKYWVEIGLYANETHLEFLQKFLGRIPAHSILLSAACGAGRYDGMLLEAGHSVVGIDQSVGMLAQARKHFPEVRYEKIGLQEMDFREEFDGAICMDAMEHICPEDWPGILRGFWKALKPGGVLYFTEGLEDAVAVEEAYKRAKKRGLPVVFGEVADQVEEASERAVVYGEVTDVSVYHYCPSLEQVRAWIEQAGLTIEEEGQTELAIDEEGTDNWYEHFVVRKK
jgi:SAM-dependent methyltransferase